MTLPKKYQQAMQDLLGEEYSAYIESMQQRSQTAIRINTAKISLEQWAEICPFKTKPVPWTEKGFLTTDEQTSLILCGLVLYSRTQCDDTGINPACA